MTSCVYQRATRAAVTLLTVLAGCAERAATDLGPPRTTLELPKALREVSGVVAAADRFLCVQDERGQLYVVDGRGEIQEQRKFGPKGDYEDLAVVDDELFVLRSDGTLLQRSLGGGDAGAEFALGRPGVEYEALAHDAKRARLLVAEKGALARGATLGAERNVLAFDLGSRSAAPGLALRLSLDACSRAAAAAGLRGRLELRISAVAVDPTGDTLWVLAGADGALFAVAWDGQVRGAWGLDRRLLPQAEGLCFDATGRMWFASEAAGGTARLVAFGRPHLPR